MNVMRKKSHHLLNKYPEWENIAEESIHDITSKSKRMKIDAK